MAGAHGVVAGELSRIERDFPGWHPWLSSGGRWWATRKGSQPADPPDWWAVTVDADDAAGLREAVARQEQLATAGRLGVNGINSQAATRQLPGVQDRRFIRDREGR